MNPRVSGGRNTTTSAEGADHIVDRSAQLGDSFAEFRRARARFFEKLRIESELYRLERVWELPPVTERPELNH